MRATNVRAREPNLLSGLNYCSAPTTLLPFALRILSRRRIQHPGNLKLRFHHESAPCRLPPVSFSSSMAKPADSSPISQRYMYELSEPVLGKGRWGRISGSANGFTQSMNMGGVGFGGTPPSHFTCIDGALTCAQRNMPVWSCPSDHAQPYQ